MSIKKIYPNWKMLKLNKCPILGCDGNLFLESSVYKCDTCTRFSITKKRFISITFKNIKQKHPKKGASIF